MVFELLGNGFPTEIIINILADIALDSLNELLCFQSALVQRLHFLQQAVAQLMQILYRHQGRRDHDPDSLLQPKILHIQQLAFRRLADDPPEAKQDRIGGVLRQYFVFQTNEKLVHILAQRLKGIAFGQNGPFEKPRLADGQLRAQRGIVAVNGQRPPADIALGDLLQLHAAGAQLIDADAAAVNADQALNAELPLQDPHQLLAAGKDLIDVFFLSILRMQNGSNAVLVIKYR